jgi:ABC-type transporter Mla subunit MlaD
MSEKVHYLRLGLFVILAGGLGILTLAFLGAGDFLKKELLVETCFDSSVQGLDVGSPVKYRGIVIGNVKTITGASRVYQVRSNYVLVVIALSEDLFIGQENAPPEEMLQKAIQEGLTVHLALQGLTGTAYLETDFIGDGSDREAPHRLLVPWETLHPYIPSVSNRISRITDSLDTIMKNLQAINVQGIADSLQALFTTLEKTLGDLDAGGISLQARSLLKEVRTTNENLSRLLASENVSGLFAEARAAASGLRTLVETSTPPLRETLDSVRSAAARADRLVDTLDGRLVPILDSLAARAETVMSNLEKASAQVETLTWSQTATLEDSLQNLRAFTENLKQMSQDLKRYPSRLIFEKPLDPMKEAHRP